MEVEAASGYYSFTTTKTEEHAKLDQLLETTRIPAPFFHNPLHDLRFVSGFFQFYDKYGTNLSPSMASYLAHLTTLKRLLVDSYTMAEATLMVNEAARSETHQGVIQQIDQILADPRPLPYTYPLFVLL